MRRMKFEEFPSGRFTEIWVPHRLTLEHMAHLLAHNVDKWGCNLEDGRYVPEPDPLDDMSAKEIERVIRQMLVTHGQELMFPSAWEGPKWLLDWAKEQVAKAAPQGVPQ